MTRVAYVNGAFVPLEEASVSVLDRGFLFADGVYEVSAVLDGRLVDNEAHLARLRRSLGELDIEAGHLVDGLPAIEEELVQRNGLAEGIVYIQITRGAAERDFGFPKESAPSLVLFTQVKTIAGSPAAEAGVKVVSVPDIRWERRDIKSTALLAQVLAKQEAVKAGAFEAWMVEDGFVTEGSSSTAFLVTGDGVLVTRPLSNAVLPGITRRSVLKLAADCQLKVEERPFTLDEARTAAEAFITSASSFVMPVVELDGRAIGDGKPGPVTRRMREVYLGFARGAAPDPGKGPGPLHPLS